MPIHQLIDNCNFLAIMYNNSMNVHVQVFVCMYIFNLLVYVYSGVEFIDHMVSTCLNSEGLLRPFSCAGVRQSCAGASFCFIQPGILHELCI